MMRLDGVAWVVLRRGAEDGYGDWKLGGTCMCQGSAVLPNDTTVSFLPYMEHIIKVLSKNDFVDETFGYYTEVLR